MTPKDIANAKVDDMQEKIVFKDKAEMEKWMKKQSISEPCESITIQKSRPNNDG